MPRATTTVVSGDLHARLDKCRQLFSDIGLLRCPTDDPWQDERQPGFHHIQLGDTVSLGYGEREADFYRWIFDVVGIDEPLIGNHELPALWWDPGAVMFQGWHDLDEVDDPLRRATYQWPVGRDRDAVELVRARAVEYRIAASVGEWLITHAGMSACHAEGRGLTDMPAVDIAAWLNDHYAECQAQRRSSAVIDSRDQVEGGIAWLRIEHLIAEYADGARELGQIVGHSGYHGEPALHEGRVWIIDTPDTNTEAVGRSDLAGVAALVSADDGASWQLHYVP